MSRTSSPAPSTPDPGPSSARPSMFLIASITVTGILANTLPNAGIPDILEDFGQGDSAAGLLVAAASIPGIVVAPVIGLLADRYGRRTVLVPCLVAFGLFGLLGALAPSYGLLITARFGQGLGSAGLINLTNILIGDHWEGLERTRMFGYNSAILTVSLAVLPFIGGFLTDLGGWRLAFVPYPLALITAWTVLRRLERGTIDRSTTVGDQLRSALEVVRMPTVLAPIGLAFATFILVFGLFLTVLPVHLEEDFGMNATQRGLIIAVPAIGATLGALIIGRLRALVAAPTIAAASFGMFALAYPIIGTTGALLLLVAGAITYGLGEGLLLTTLTDIVAGAAPERSRGAVMSVQMGAVRAGQTTGPLLGGIGMGFMSTGAIFITGGLFAGVLCLAVILVGVGRH